MRNHGKSALGRFKITLVLTALALAAAACSSSSSTTSSGTSPSATGVSSASAPAGAIKIGILTTCGGPFATFENESFSGAKYALVQDAGGTAQGQAPEAQVTGATAGGKPISISFGCSDATPDVAVASARRLVESTGVKILLGPLSGDEGIAVAHYAKSQPGVTFVNGTSGAQATTLTVKAPNFYRFGGDGAQWMAGLGTYAYKTLGWRHVAILGEDYSYPYTQAAGFIKEFCSLGGDVSTRQWVPLGTTDWSSAVARLPRNLNGVLLLTGGTDTVAAEKAFQQLGENPGKMLLGGSSVLDPTSFTVGNSLVGLAGGSPVPLGGSSAAWTSYVSGFGKVYPSAPADSLFTVLYYDGMKAIITALNQVHGDLSNNEAAFRAALDSLHPSFPNGQVSLDANRNSIQPAFVVQITQSGGRLGFKVLKTVPDVSQTFGGLFSASSPAPSRTSPACTTGAPPPWATGSS
jgi:branched-chain amino acid transport system substrate-binding protein